MTATAQMTLALGDLVVPEYPADATIQARFELFHQSNPWVLTALEKLTEQYLDTGATALGIRMLWERFRWEFTSQTRGDEFKANNNYASRYVRLIQERHPEWRDVFSTRELRAA